MYVCSRHDYDMCVLCVGYGHQRATDASKWSTTDGSHAQQQASVARSASVSASNCYTAVVL